MKDSKQQFLMMLCALSKIPNEYILYKGNSKSQAERLLNERVFAYEFYHQWRNVLEEKNVPYLLNGEIKKDAGFVGFCANNDNYEGNYKNETYPDIVLHESYSKTKGRNIIVCEVKVNKYKGYTKYLEDIASVATFVSRNACSGNPYEMGVFILVGNNGGKEASDVIDFVLSKRIKAIMTKCEEYLNTNTNKPTYNNIILVAYNSKKDIRCYNLGEYVNENY